MQMLERKQEAIHCRCGYIWNTKSVLQYVTCPSCRHLNHRRNDRAGEAVTE